jgi:putative CocE/NonD family hydrolase
MRDGVELATHIYLPEGDGPFPVFLMRTPYDAMSKGRDALEWPGRGYALVTQDVRGRFISDGEFYPWFNEKNDGEDTLEWISNQPWCDGNVAMYGGSYPGATQVAAAVSGHPALKCFTPALIGSAYYHVSYWGGAFRLYWQTSWALAPKEGVDRAEVNKHLPLIDSDVFSSDKEVPYWRGALNHPHLDDFWKPTTHTELFKDVKAPAFIRTGWFDLFVCDVFDMFNGIRNQAASEEARQFTRIIVGPWPHNINQRVVGEEDFGEVALINDLYEQEIAYIGQCVKGQYETGVAPIRIFVMGTNQWRDEYEWPLARTNWTELFLSSGGNANTSAGDGTLGSAASGAPDSFDYDPADPVPTNGGAWEFVNIGPRDQSELELRKDVLVYTSDELEDDLEVTGPVEVKLFASSSARDTDFTAKLVDVRPDGKAMSVTDGIIRARYRHQNGTEELLEAGQVYEFTIRCNPTAMVFKKGHKLRLEISSSNFPVFSRNLNTGNDIPTDTEMEVAHQTIYHSAEYPSRIILPVIR